LQNPRQVILSTAAERKALLERSKTIAVVGASAKPDRPSHGVFAYLRAHHYDAVPVAPKLDELHGVKAYPNLTAYAAEHGPPDVVDVFRKPADVLPIVDEAIAVGAKAIWFQLGIVNEEAIARADNAGLDVVFDKCMKVEHRDLLSG
jgi:predicted CoA-binding protein